MLDFEVARGAVEFVGTYGEPVEDVGVVELPDLPETGYMYTTLTLAFRYGTITTRGEEPWRSRCGWTRPVSFRRS